MSQRSADINLADEDRYLIFRIGKERFAAPLLSVREIVETLAYRDVPNPFDYFLGLANLRGQIVGVLDFGIRFGLESVAASKNGVFLVFDFDGASMAGFVNSVESVVTIPSVSIDRECHIDVAIPESALIGIAKTSSGLLSIIQFSELIRQNDAIAV
jgi:purine-binding chemotaxis protein CheW